MNSDGSLKHVLSKTLPTGIVDLLKACRYRGCLGHFDYLYKKRRYERRFQALNKDLPPEQITIFPGTTLTVANADVHYTFSHFTHIDPEMVEEMEAFARVMKGATTMLDVGALYGIFSLVFTGRPNTTSYALEPNPVSMGVLKQNIGLNSSRNIVPFQVAAGDVTGRLEFTDDGRHLVAMANGDGSATSSSRMVSIEVITLDGFCESKKIKPDLIKIDVEGFEYHVLKGCERVLRESKPILIIEIHPDLLTKHNISALEIMEFLRRKGYKFYDQNLAEVGSKHFSLQRVFRVICACNDLA